MLLSQYCFSTLFPSLYKAFWILAFTGGLGITGNRKLTERICISSAMMLWYRSALASPRAALSHEGIRKAAQPVRGDHLVKEIGQRLAPALRHSA